MTHDATPEQPVDLTDVAADEEALEQLRRGPVPGEDPALTLLRSLLLDVDADLPDPVPVGSGSTVLSVAAAEHLPERRLVRGGTVLTIAAAGLVSLGGVAAAGVLSPPGAPLHGLGEVVRSAAGAVAGAVTPPDSAGPDRAVLALPTPAGSVVRTAAAPPQESRPTAGATVSALVRSQAAARQVARLLDEAEQLLRGGRADDADRRLDMAERRLAEVLPMDGAAELRARLDELRRQLAAVSAPEPAPEPQTSEQPGKQPGKPPGKPGKAPADKGSTDRASTDTGSTGRARPSKDGVRGDPSRPTPSRRGGGRSAAGQASSDASAKPRA